MVSLHSLRVRLCHLMVAVSLILAPITPVRATTQGPLSEPAQAMPRSLPAAAEAASPGLPHLPPAGLALTFELDATADPSPGSGQANAAATSVRRFAKPLELRVDLAGLVDLAAMPYWQYLGLVYQDEAGGKWVGLPGHREGSVVVASLDHFSTLGSGSINSTESGWLLTFNDAHVSTFNGGLAYDYPIQVPAGRGGLTPDLTLGYNSRRVDGLLTWTQTDWAGLGWTLDTMAIARKVNPDYPPSGEHPAWYWAPYVAWSNEFTLLYKGTGYKLKPNSASAYGRYYCEDEQFLYIERHNTYGNDNGYRGSGSNETSEYWLVRLRDGTEYRLGYNHDSEQTVRTRYYDTDVGDTCHWANGSTPPTTEGCYAGHTQEVVAFQWKANYIKDSRGNEIRLAYDEEETTSGTIRERASYLREVRYNKLTGGTWGSKITLAYAAAYGETDQVYGSGHNYHVTTRTVADGQGGGYQIAYTYPESLADRCYDCNVTYGCDNAGTYGGSLVGYRWTVEALKTIGDTTLAQTRHEFKLNSEASPSRALGRELLLLRQDAGGNDLAKTVSTWEYEGNTLERDRRYLCFPNTTKWIADKVVLAEVYDGSGVAQSRTRYLYDENTSYWAVPERGDLARTRPTSSDVNTYITTQIITYSTAISYYLPIQVDDGLGHVSETFYEQTWKLYPTQVKNPLSQWTTAAYNYTLGLPTSVYGPNGASTTTSYVYDWWGRLEKVIHPGDTSTYPSLRYAYCDTCSPYLRISTYERVTSGQAAELGIFRYYNGLGQLIQAPPTHTLIKVEPQMLDGRRLRKVSARARDDRCPRITSSPDSGSTPRGCWTTGHSGMTLRSPGLSARIP